LTYPRILQKSHNNLGRYVLGISLIVIFTHAANEHIHNNGSGHLK